MPRKSTVDQLKLLLEKAPEIPTNTCPYFDFVLKILEDIKEESTSHQIGEKIDLIESHIEYLRSANQTLRDGGEYWYYHCKDYANSKKS